MLIPLLAEYDAAAMALVKDEFDHRLAVWLSVLGAAALAPFTLMHLSVGNGTMLALVGALNLLYLVGAGLLWRRRYVQVTHYVLAAATTTVGFMVIVHDAASSLYWAYPLVLVNFYVLPLRMGLVFNGLFALALVPVLPALVEPVAQARVLATLLMVNVFAYLSCYRVQRKQQALERLALHDPLTGAGNRRRLQEELNTAVELYRRYRRPVSLMVLDVDHFKRINDSLGHAGGDRVLRLLADCVRERLRRNDTLYRFGGEEFVVLAPQTDLRGAVDLAEALRRRIAGTDLLPRAAVTASFGVAQLLPNQDAEDWLRQADQALYEAKRLGRNRVEVASAVRRTG